MHPIFKIREEHTPQILGLLNSVTLGTNGAQYRHLDNSQRIKECDNPLFLSMERNKVTIGNVTFCRRGDDWYIRYFAMSPRLQSAAVKKSKSNKSNLLKRELNDFFQSTLDGQNDLGKVSSFYAYIDPNNEKSLWMSEDFGFNTIGKIATQTFSRVKPKKSNRVQKIEDWHEVKELVNTNFENYNYFHSAQTEKPPFYVIKDENGEIIAFAKISISTWEIERLPGRLGGVLTRVIPYIPRLNKLVRPKIHTSVVPEAVMIKDNNPELLDDFFQGILHQEEKSLILWWVDENEKLYIDVKPRMKWGLLHKLVGVNNANVVQRSNCTSNSNHPFYTSGFDFI